MTYSSIAACFFVSGRGCFPFDITGSFILLQSPG
jgi:hypothetical protein